MTSWSWTDLWSSVRRRRKRSNTTEVAVVADNSRDKRSLLRISSTSRTLSWRRNSFKESSTEQAFKAKKKESNPNKSCYDIPVDNCHGLTRVWEASVCQLQTVRCWTFPPPGLYSGNSIWMSEFLRNIISLYFADMEVLDVCQCQLRYYDCQSLIRIHQSIIYQPLQTEKQQHWLWLWRQLQVSHRW